ncbi:MAG: LysM peptidoglycan-binding domain-containing protein [Bacteroidota bacterium]
MSRRKNPRRSHARAGVDWPVTIASGNATLEGKIKNISRGGALIYLAKNLEVHEQIRLAIEIPEFEDVISAKAEVVRTSSAITDNNLTSYAIAVKFTEISNEDLRYFTGNIAVEWQDDNEESTPHTTINSLIRKIGYIFTICCVIFIIFYLLQLNSKYQVEEKRIEQLKNKIGIIESKIKESKEIEQYITDLEKNINTIEGQLVSINNKFINLVTIKKIQHQTDYVEEKIEKINHSVKSSRQTEIVLTPLNKKKSVFLYYVVKRGDNLYRIGLKHGITVNKIKELNNMSQDESIYPGQKLIVGWKL